MKKIKKVRITNQKKAFLYKNNAITFFSPLFNGNITLAREDIFLEMEDYKIKRFESTIYKLSKKTKVTVFNHQENLQNISSLKESVLNANYNLYLNIFSFFFNFNLVATFLTNLSINFLFYLNDNPIGIKQNTLLKTYFSTFFIFAFKIHLKITNLLPRMIPFKFHFFHLIICHNVISKIYYITFRVLCDTINIFGGRNYNKMKKRIDIMIYPPDVIILSSFIFVFSSLIMYTIIGFYVFSLIFRASFSFFLFCFETFFIFFGTNFEKKGILVKEKRKEKVLFINYKTKEIFFWEKMLFSMKMALKKCKINKEFFNKCFTGDCQINLKN